MPLLCLPLAMALGACGSGGGADGGPGDAGDGGIAPWPAPPAPPAPPDFGGCPPGWLLAGGDGSAEYCEPWPDGEPQSCSAVDEAHFPGEPGCIRVGTGCPADGWPTDLPADRPVLWLRAEAVGGDGSRGLPFGTFAEAGLDALAPGTVLALGVGTYGEGVTLGDGIALVGACVAETMLSVATSSRDYGTITVTGADTLIRNLRIQDTARTGIWAVGSTADLHIEDVVVEGATLGGVVVDRGAHVGARSLVIHDTRSDSSGLYGRGLDVWRQGAAELSRAVIDSSREYGVNMIDDGSFLALEDTAVSNSQARPSDLLGGVGVRVGAVNRTELRRVALESNALAGASVITDGDLLLQDVIVRNTRSQELDGELGSGLLATERGSATVRRSSFHGNHSISILIGEGGELLAEDILVVGTLPQEGDGLYGRGLQVQGSGSVHVVRAAFEHDSETAVAITGGATATIEDLTVSDTEGIRGLVVELGADATVARARFDRVLTIVVDVVGEGSALRMSDVAIRDAREVMDYGGWGLVVRGQATLELARGLLERNREVGLVIMGEGTSARMEDIAVRDTLGLEVLERMGVGMAVQEGGSSEVVRALFERNRYTGVGLTGAGSSARFQDLVVRDTMPQACVESRCPDEGGGHGVAVVSDALLAADGFTIRGSALCGLLITRGAGVELRNGLITQNVVGACLPDADYDIDGLTATVRYVDNGINLEARTLPVPSALSPLPDP